MRKSAIYTPRSLARYALLAAAGLSASLAQAQTDYEVSGDISILSGYVFRGITNTSENDGAAVQAGFAVSGDSGLYGGWWASNLGYGTPDLATTVENNFYAGFSGEAGGLRFDIGALYYWFMDDSDASAIEPYLGIGLGAFDVGVHYLAEDASWGNQGDMYFTLGTGVDLRDGFSASVQVNYASYEGSGKYIATTAESSSFRGVELTLGKALEDLPVNMFATYILGGEDRSGVSQEDKVIVGLSLSF